MKKCIRLIAGLILTVTILVCCSTAAFAQSTTIKLNESGFAYAEMLIEKGQFVLDKKNDWRDHHPTAQQANNFIRTRGFPDYAKWHLGIDAAHGQNTKARYKFPFGDFKNIYRSAVLAVKSRAHQFRYSHIENAAAHLLEMMEQHK
jgi:hypothetical protein